MEQDDTPESLASGSSSSSAPASRLNAAGPEFKPRPVDPGEGEGIAAVAAEDRVIEAPEPWPRLIEADARKVLEKVEFYFSDIILATTKHLMEFITDDPDGFVPISKVAALTKFPKIVLVAALHTSSQLVVSEDGKKVKRRQPFIAAEVQSRIVVAENLPVDHKNLPVDRKHQTVVNFFSAVGSVKSIRTYHLHDSAAAAASKTLRIDTPFSHKLHAFVEFESVGDAEKAVAEFSGGGKCRDGFRVRSLLGCLKHGLGEVRIRGDEGGPDTSGHPHDYGTDDIAHILEVHFDQDVLEDGKKVLLKTPSGFALFHVEKVALKEDKNIWMYFANSREAHKVLLALGYVKAHPHGAACTYEDLCNLIEKFCKNGEALYVEDRDLKVSIEKKLDVFCICDGDTVRELFWGIKNVLHEFIREEKDNVMAECLPLSQELVKALKYYLINISAKKVDSYFISTFGYLCYMDMNLEAVAKVLRSSYDKFVGVSEMIEDDLTYAKVLAIALVPEFVQQYDFSKNLSQEVSLKLEEANKFIAQSEETDFTLYDIKRIVGSLDYLLNGPKVRDQILTRVKLMEASRFRSEADQIMNDRRCASGHGPLHEIDETLYGDHVDFEGWKFTRTLLETPLGFAIFDVHDVVFQYPKRIWTYFSDTYDARDVAFALGFVKVEDKSVAWNNVTQSGDKLRNLILRFCKNKELFVQNSVLKDIIKSKLDVDCSTNEVIAHELMWGLRFVLPDFIPEESDNLADGYYLPPCKEVQKYLKRYSINFPPTKIDRDFIYLLGHAANLDFALIDSLAVMEWKNLVPQERWENFEVTIKSILQVRTLNGFNVLKVQLLREIGKLDEFETVLHMCKQKVFALEDLRFWNSAKGACLLSCVGVETATHMIRKREREMKLKKHHPRKRKSKAYRHAGGKGYPEEVEGHLETEGKVGRA